jgi:hypothetical protein
MLAKLFKGLALLLAFVALAWLVDYFIYPGHSSRPPRIAQLTPPGSPTIPLTPPDDRGLYPKKHCFSLFYARTRGSLSNPPTWGIYYDVSKNHAWPCVGDRKPCRPAAWICFSPEWF